MAGLLYTKGSCFSKGVYFHDTIPKQLVACVHHKIVPTSLNESTQTCAITNNNKEVDYVDMKTCKILQSYKVMCERNFYLYM